MLKKIKPDCLFYVQEAKNCNGYIQKTCTDCKFYQSATDKEQAEYITKMKRLNSYISKKEV